MVNKLLITKSLTSLAHDSIATGDSFVASLFSPWTDKTRLNPEKLNYDEIWKEIKTHFAEYKKLIPKITLLLKDNLYEIAGSQEHSYPPRYLLTDKHLVALLGLALAIISDKSIIYNKEEKRQERYLGIIVPIIRATMYKSLLANTNTLSVLKDKSIEDEVKALNAKVRSSMYSELTEVLKLIDKTLEIGGIDTDEDSDMVKLKELAESLLGQEQ